MTKRNRKMCVKIARDVLYQLRQKRYISTPRTYVNVNDPSNNIYFGDIDQSFKDFFRKNESVKCEVCAIGAAFVSTINIENKCTIDEMCRTTGMWDRVEKYFGARNIELMESAFEREAMTMFDDANIRLLNIAAKWGRQYDSSEKRLRAIFLNIIRNNGDFKLPKKMLARV